MTNFVYKPSRELKSQNETKVVLELVVPENLYYFQGHFPQAAILPGVVQLDWVMFYLTEFFSFDASSIASIDVLKFQHIVRPGYKIELTLEQVKDNKFNFNYQSSYGQHSSGRVVVS